MVDCAQGGTCVALSSVAMRLSETITIYLAAGAPFAVSFFLHQRGHRRAHLFLKTIAAGLFWPLLAVRLLLARRAGFTQTDAERKEEKLEEEKRNLLTALLTVREAGRDDLREASEKLERAACVLRDSFEKYVGLAQAAKEAKADRPPDARELELFRLAGRKGADLLLAGKCVHRRNVARLIEHRARARMDLLHALAEISEAADQAPLSTAANACKARRLSLAALRLYGYAIDVLSLLEDPEAAMRVAQLLNRECARLRLLQSAATGLAVEQETGEELCTAHTSRQPLVQLPDKRTLVRG